MCFILSFFCGKDIPFKGCAAALGTVCEDLANKCVISNSFILDDPDLKDIDPTVLKHCHAAAATCILEAGKQKADISAISTCLEDCKLDKERIEQFCTEYQKNKDALEILLGRTVIQDHTQMLVLVARWNNSRYFFPSSLFLCLALVVYVNVFNNLPIKMKLYILLLKKNQKTPQDQESRGETSIKIIQV
uniref:COMM domain containing 3 n=1 Tax=Accipiter nisus TaxID=211598 RepID=A0A8B9RW33_9AVES